MNASKDFEKEIMMSKDQVVSLKEKNIQINCLYGQIWITWPNGFERILKSGQSVSISSKGKTCIIAFSKSLVQIQKRGWQLSHILALVMGKKDDMLTSPGACEINYMKI